MTVSAPRRRSAYEISLNGIKLRTRMPIQGRPEPGTEPPDWAAYDDFRGGLGASIYGLPSMYDHGRFIDTTGFGAAVPAGELVEIPISSSGYISGAFESAGNLFFTHGQHVSKIPGGTADALTTVHAFASGIRSEDVVNFGGQFRIGTQDALGASDWLWSTTTGETGTYTQSSDVKRRHLGKVYWVNGGVGAHRLLGTPNVYSFQSVTGDPMVEANWTSAITVGDQTKHIRKIVTLPMFAAFLKQDGIFGVSSNGYTPNYTPHWDHTYHIDNGIAGAAIGPVLLASHAFGVDRLELNDQLQGTPEPCEPGAYLPYTGPTNGLCTAMVYHRGWVYASYWNFIDNESHILMGRQRKDANVPGPGPIVWHGSYASVPGITTLLYINSPEGVQNCYLWIGTENLVDSAPVTTFHLYRQYVTKYGSLLAEKQAGGSPRFYTGADSYLQVGDAWGRDRSRRRLVAGYEMQAESLDATNSVELRVAHDGGAFPDEAEAVMTEGPREFFWSTDDPTSGYRLQFRVNINTTDPTDPPAFYTLRVRAFIKQDQQHIKTYQVEIGRPGWLLSDGVERRDPDAVLAQLWALQDIDTNFVEMINERGKAETVRVLPTMRYESVQVSKRKRETMLVFEVEPLGGRDYYDTNEFYDTDSHYSGDDS